MEDGFFVASYRLPSESEWEYAAQALVGRTEAGVIAERRVYPWNERGIRFGPGNRQGDMKANLKQNYNALSGVGTYEVVRGGPTAPGRYYKPNDFGLYNMAGNVNEWVMDMYRPTTPGDADEVNPFMGGGYLRTTLDEEGALGKDSSGPVLYVGDERRYTDNYLASYLDSLAVQSNPNGQVNNRIRVYKGGSYRDQAYWITPGARRFLQENRSKDDIGFRCAMSGVAVTNMKAR